MKTVTEYIRDHLLMTLGYPTPTSRMPSLEALRESEWSPRFERLMRNRLIMGAFRYGTFDEKNDSPGRYQYAKDALRRLAAYLDTGNTEILVDVANMCLLEFEFGQHPMRHFRAVDDAEHTPDTSH